MGKCGPGILRCVGNVQEMEIDGMAPSICSFHLPPLNAGRYAETGFCILLWQTYFFRRFHGMGEFYSTLLGIAENDSLLPLVAQRLQDRDAIRSLPEDFVQT